MEAGTEAMLTVKPSLRVSWNQSLHVTLLLQDTSM